MRQRFLLLALLLVARAGASHCSGHIDCTSCTQDSVLGAACRWCPIDEVCHDVDSPANHCTTSMEVTDASKCAALLEPEQLHIALASSQGVERPNDGMAVSWSTGARTNTSTLLWSLSPGVSPATATAAAGAATHLLAHWHHHAVVTGLPTATRVYYRVGDAAAGWSAERSFTTAPADDAPLVASVFGDLGYGQNGNALATRARLEALKDAGAFDLVWHLGDIGYADDAFLHAPTAMTYEQVYDDFMNDLQNVSAAVPYMVAPGNHESECHSPACLASSTFRTALSNFSAYNARWRMPGAESGGRGGSMWSSFNYGLAHFVSWNSETDFDGAGEETHGDSGVLPAGGFAPAGELLRWLEADLAAADTAASRAQRPWVVVGSHRQVYKPPEGKATAEIQRAVEALFLKYHVDAHFSGHAHTYGRSFPVADNNRTGAETKGVYEDPVAPTYIVAGAAGCDESHLSPGTAAAAVDGASSRVRVRGGAAAVDAGWVAHVDTTNYGTGLLHVLNRTHMRWDYVSSGTGELLDQVMIIQNKNKKKA
eukprot:g6073.t1